MQEEPHKNPKNSTLPLFVEIFLFVVLVLWLQYSTRGSKHWKGWAYRIIILLPLEERRVLALGTWVRVTVQIQRPHAHIHAKVYSWESKEGPCAWNTYSFQNRVKLVQRGSSGVAVLWVAVVFSRPIVFRKNTDNRLD